MPITNRQLIERLQKLPLDAPALRADAEFGLREIGGAAESNALYERNDMVPIEDCREIGGEYLFLVREANGFDYRDDSQEIVKCIVIR